MGKNKTKSKIKQYLVYFTSEYGYFPTYEEIQKDCKLKSVSTVYYHLRALEKEDFIERRKGKTYIIKNTGIFFKIPLKYKIQNKTLLKIKKVDHYFPAQLEDADSLAIKVEDSSLEEHNVKQGSVLFVKNIKDGIYTLMYIDADNRIILSDEQLKKDELIPLGAVYSIFKLMNKEPLVEQKDTKAVRENASLKDGTNTLEELRRV